MSLEALRQSLESQQRQLTQELAAATNSEAVEQLRVKYLGRKSALSEGMKLLGTLLPEERAEAGRVLNAHKTDYERRIAQATQQACETPSAEPADVTLPGLRAPLGRLHPITQTLERIVECFVPMGFEIIEGPEMEFEWNNFDALNIPADHPSRESFDTFFVDAVSPEPRKGRLLLRSHTSPVQIRVMQARKPPLRIVVPGRVYRPDAPDASHSFMFHQVEGLMVDDTTSFADLKGVLAQFIERFFGTGTRMRFRPHFFPFTEPSAEVDIVCATCLGKGCQTCGRKGWLEILGCGMVHPNVLKAVGYEPRQVQGFAFGMGVERMAMLRHGISDIRLFVENDLRFLEQF